MPRTKNTKVTKQRRKKIMKMAKGYFGSKRTLYRTANEQVMRSMRYQYRDRKQRKRQFRKLWITRINAACQLNDIKYSRFIHGLKIMNIEIDRKILSDIAIHDPNAFSKYCELAKEGLKKAETILPTPKQTSPSYVSLDNLDLVVEPKVKTKVVEKEVVVAPKIEKEVIVKTEPKQNEADLNNKTVAELRDFAKNLGLTGFSSLKKAELISLILNN